MTLIRTHATTARNPCRLQLRAIPDRRANFRGHHERCYGQCEPKTATPFIVPRGEAQLLGPFDSSMASEMAALRGQVVTTILATDQQFDPALLRLSCRVATRPWRSAPA